MKQQVYIACSSEENMAPDVRVPYPIIYNVVIDYIGVDNDSK